MIARLTASLLCFTLLAGSTLLTEVSSAAEPRRVTDLVPQKALGSIFFRNINELRKNGDQLFADVGWPFAPSQLLSWVGQELKVNGLVDGDQPCGVLWFDAEDGANETPGFKPPPAAALFAIRDVDALAQRLGTTAAELKAGKTIHLPGQLGYVNRYYRLADDYLWIVTHEKLFVELSNRMPLTFAIAKSRRERMQNCDILLSFRPTAMAADREQMLEGSQKWIAEHPELSAEEQKALRELFGVMEAMSNVVLGARIHNDGIELDADVYFDFRKRKAVQAVLQRFNPTNAASSLNELPGGQVLFSHALQADGKATLPALNAMLPQLSPLHNWRQNGLEVLTEAQQLKTLGLLGEVWRQINGYRMAAYQMDDPAQHGMLGLAAVLDTSDPDQVIAEIRELAEFIDGTHLYLAADSSEPAASDNTSSKEPAVPELSPAGEARVRRLIEQLSDDDFAVRQSATIRLMLIGEPVRPFVGPLVAREDKPSGKRDEEQNDKQASDQSDDQLPVSARHARRVIASLNAARKPSNRRNSPPRLINSADLRFSYSTRQMDLEAADGTPQTVHEIKIEQASASPQQVALQQQMLKLFGPDWNRLRLVPFDNRLIVLLGSDESLHRRVIASVTARSQELQIATVAATYGTALNAARGAEFHVDLAGILEHFSRRIPAPKPEVKTVPRETNPAEDTQSPDGKQPPGNEQRTGAASSDGKPADSAADRTATKPPATTPDSTAGTAPADTTAADARPADGRPAIDFSSLTFTIQDDYLSFEWRAPVSDIKALNAMN